MKADMPHYSSIDALRAFSCFLVIVIHVASDTPYSSDLGWSISNMLNSFSRMAVPIFIIISAYLMSAKKYDSYLLFIKKRVFRIFPVIIAWSYFYGWFNNKDIFSVQFLLSLLSGPTMFHLWYLYAIVGIYLLIPILSSFRNSYGDGGILTLFGIWFVFGCITPLLSDIYQLNSAFISNFNLNQISGVAGYAITGVAIHSFMRLRPQVLLCSLLVLICNALTAYFTFLRSHESGNIYQAFYSYTSPLVAIAAICMTLACLRIDFSKIPVPLSRLISLVSSVSLGVYCVHMFMFTSLDMLYSNYIGSKADVMAYFVVFMPVAVLLGSVILSFLLKKIPYLNKCV